ncbi:MAG: hypothetical protein QOI36_994 [Pseudonocardiales bacterium]|nr:hypothetical protein [Pseudonocardiales bacterium]
MAADPPHRGSLAHQTRTGRRRELEMRRRMWAVVAPWLVWRWLW